MTASASSLSEENAQKTSSALPAIETLVDPERLACAQELEARAAVSDSEAARSAADDAWMDLALAQARKAWRISPPNPSVGAVIVRNGRLVGAGHTQRTGGPHAEVMALRSAFERGLSVEGATVYVTLEPCSHYGRTPPCALALIQSKVGRVVAAVGDPNPKVHGRGIRMLLDAGIPAELGVREAEAREVNIAFLTRMTRGTPWVRMKTAVTLDGRTAFPDGRSQWITGEAARADVQFWRGRAGAVLTGIGTVLADDPQMNVRLPDQERQPLRIVIDPRMETPPAGKLLTSKGGRVFIAAAAEYPTRRAALEAAGAKVWVLPDAAAPGRVDLRELMRELAKREVNEVHVEAGPRLSGALFAAGLIDEMLFYYAPCLFGAGMGPAAVPLPAEPGAAYRWRLQSLDQIGGDLGGTGKAAGETGALHGIQRQEGGAARALVLQKADGRTGAALVFDHDVLQSKAEGRLDGGLIAFFDGEDARHRADDAPQTTARSGAHDGLDALLVAVHVALQVFQNVDTLGGVGPLFVGLLQRVGSFSLLAAAAFQFQL